MSGHRKRPPRSPPPPPPPPPFQPSSPSAPPPAGGAYYSSAPNKSISFTSLPGMMTPINEKPDAAVHEEDADAEESSLFVQHCYHDRANDPAPPEDAPAAFETTATANNNTKTFPHKLYRMLERVEDDGYTHIVSWQPHGLCFVVRNSDLFKDILPKYFGFSKVSSYQRQLNLWGFSRLTRGMDRGGYYHECFLRGKPHLIPNITRVTVNGRGVRCRANPDDEPDFWRGRYGGTVGAAAGAAGAAGLKETPVGTATASAASACPEKDKIKSAPVAVADQRLDVQSSPPGSTSVTATDSVDPSCGSAMTPIAEASVAAVRASPRDLNSIMADSTAIEFDGLLSGLSVPNTAAIDGQQREGGPAWVQQQQHQRSNSFSIGSPRPSPLKRAAEEAPERRAFSVPALLSPRQLTTTIEPLHTSADPTWAAASTPSTALEPSTTTTTTTRNRRLTEDEQLLNLTRLLVDANFSLPLPDSLEPAPIVERSSSSTTAVLTNTRSNDDDVSFAETKVAEHEFSTNSSLVVPLVRPTIPSLNSLTALDDPLPPLPSSGNQNPLQLPPSSSLQHQQPQQQHEDTTASLPAAPPPGDESGTLEFFDEMIKDLF